MRSARRRPVPASLARPALGLAIGLLLTACATPGAPGGAAPPEGPAPAAPGPDRREVGSLVLENVPEVPQAVKDDLFRYQAVRSAAFRGFDPGGGLLVSTRFGNTDQIHHVAGPGAAREQLTFHPEPVYEAFPSPDPSRRGFLFLKDEGGDEFDQIFWYDLDDRSFRQLTDGESLNGSPVWAPDGSRFAYFSTRRNGKDWDLYVGTTESPETARRVLEVEGTWVPLAFAPGGDRLLVQRYVSINESTLHLLDLDGGELTAVDPSADPADAPVAYGEDAAFSPDGGVLYFSSDRGSEFRRLRRLELSTGRIKTLTEDLDWDVGDIEAAKDRPLVAFEVNEGGVSRLYLLDTATGARRPVSGLPAGLVGGLGFDPTGRRLGFTVTAHDTPGDAFVLDLGSGLVTPWTRSEVGGLPTDELLAPELVHYPTFDSADGEPRRIPAFYYRPEGEGPFPVVVKIHGGPEAQVRPWFSSFNQYLLREMGVAVLEPNVRGSSGYGKIWLRLDNAERREDSVRDIGALLDWIGTQPDLDPQRVCVFGGSYGGYMVLASLVHFGEQLRCGVDVVGIANFVTFLESTEPYRQDLRRAEYGDERDPEMRAFLERISPANQADRITSPLFIVQGANDPRVPASEAEIILEAVRAQGGEPWYMLARDEGHGFRKKVNRDAFLEATMLFLRRHLEPSGDAPAEE